MIRPDHLVIHWLVHRDGRSALLHKFLQIPLKHLENGTHSTRSNWTGKVSISTLDMGDRDGRQVRLYLISLRPLLLKLDQDRDPQKWLREIWTAPKGKGPKKFCVKGKKIPSLPSQTCPHLSYFFCFSSCHECWIGVILLVYDFALFLPLPPFPPCFAPNICPCPCPCPCPLFCPCISGQNKGQGQTLGENIG